MIVYSFKEEIRIIIYLISYGVCIVGMYDFFVSDFKRKRIKIFYEVIYTVLAIVYTYHFSYKLCNGYIPQYSIVFILLGIIVYFIFFKKQFNVIRSELMCIVNKIIMFFRKILRPFRIFKQTIFEFFKRKNKNNNQNTLQK